jgi:hypothetical protein
MRQDSGIRPAKAAETARKLFAAENPRFQQMIAKCTPCRACHWSIRTRLVVIISGYYGLKVDLDSAASWYRCNQVMLYKLYVDMNVIRERAKQMNST